MPVSCRRPIRIGPVRRLRAVVVLAAALFATLWPSSTRVDAHASLVGSEPAYASVLTAAPTQVRLLFDSPVEPGLVKVRLRDAAGTEVGKGELIGDRNTRAVVELTLPAHGPGEWVVSWVTFAFDGHVVSGTIPYTVDPDGTPSVGSTAPGGTEGGYVDAGGTNTVIDIVDIQVRFVSYLALAAVAGAALWLWLLHDRSGAAVELLRTVARKTVPVAAVVAAVTVLARGGVALWRLLDGGFVVNDLGPLLWTGQLSVFVLAAAVALAAGDARHPLRATALAALAVALPATAGHASSYAAPGVGAALVALHAAAAIVWVGSTAVLAYVAADKAFTADPDRWTTLRPALDRLSAILIGGFAVLAVTGARAAAVFADGMPEGRWGLTLVAKSVLVAVAALLGGFHYLRGRRGRALTPVTLAVEAAVLCLTFTAAAVLAVTVPA